MGRWRECRAWVGDGWDDDKGGTVGGIAGAVERLGLLGGYSRFPADGESAAAGDYGLPALRA